MIKFNQLWVLGAVIGIMGSSLAMDVFSPDDEDYVLADDRRHRPEAFVLELSQHTYRDFLTRLRQLDVTRQFRRIHPAIHVVEPKLIHLWSRILDFRQSYQALSRDELERQSRALTETIEALADEYQDARELRCVLAPRESYTVTESQTIHHTPQPQSQPVTFLGTVAAIFGTALLAGTAGFVAGRSYQPVASPTPYDNHRPFNTTQERKQQKKSVQPDRKM